MIMFGTLKLIFTFATITDGVTLIAQWYASCIGTLKLI